MRRLLAAGLTCAALYAWPAAAAEVSGPAVEWLAAAGDGDIERAFAQAREQSKPVLLYWGAKWCPPCNQLKATLFNRQDFIARSRAVVAVAIDGDAVGAQKLGERFRVRGYPTMILFAADGREITRLPGEVDPPQALAVLQLALSSRPVKAVLVDALAGKPLPAAEWRLIAFYAWDADEDRLVARGERAGVLAQLALACPAEPIDASDRLLLRALAESSAGKGLAVNASTRERVRRLLDDPAAARPQMDLIVGAAAEITQMLAPAPGRDRHAVLAAFDTALGRLQADATLSRADRSGALFARVDLARLPFPKDERQPKLPAALLAQVREQAARDEREIVDGYERQAVITTDASLLAHAGLWAESDRLLKANLDRSHSPYYLMEQLGSNARKNGRPAEALRWYEQAWERSEGPATRLQWGSAYFSALIDLAPAGMERVERVATRIFDEAARDPAAFHERSARSLQRLAGKVAAWGTAPDRGPVMKRLQSRITSWCAGLPRADPQRATCDAVARSITPPAT